MPQKIDLKKTRQSLDKLIEQAKESVKVLETLKNEGVARAKAFLPPIPGKDEGQKLAKAKLLESLKKMGIATRSEVRELEKKIEALTTELRSTKASRKVPARHQRPSANEVAEDYVDSEE